MELPRYTSCPRPELTALRHTKMKDELLLGGEQRKTASTGSINSPTAASGWSRGTPPALLARPAQKSERLQCLDACRGLNVALMILVDSIFLFLAGGNLAQ